MTIEILLANKNDVADIAKLSYEVGRLHDEALPDYFKPSTKEDHLRIISEMLNSKTEVIFKAVYEGNFCGFLCLLVPERPRNGFIHEKTGVILNLGVDEAYRGKGIGTTLIDAAEKYLRQKGITAMEFDVYTFNVRAVKLYERLGYKVIEQHFYKILDK